MWFAPRVNSLSLAIAVARRVCVPPQPAERSWPQALRPVPMNSVVAEEAAEGDQVLEEVVVTRSAHRAGKTSRRTALSILLMRQLFEQTSAVGVENSPEPVTAVRARRHAIHATADVQKTVTNTVGALTVSLRGLGPNRTLVLINGWARCRSIRLLVVDTELIPGPLIRPHRSDLGRASAVYGSDAIAGVVNFILKDNYEGANIDVRFGDTLEPAAIRPPPSRASSAPTWPTAAVTSCSASSATRASKQLTHPSVPGASRTSSAPQHERRRVRLRKRDVVPQRTGPGMQLRTPTFRPGPGGGCDIIRDP